MAMFNPSASTGLVLLAARLMMAIEFVVFGAMKIPNNHSMQIYMEGHGVPGALIWPALVLQLVAGLLVAVGLFTRAAAVALAGFCLVATFLFHLNLGDLREVSDLTKDLSTAGGLLLLAVLGAGPISLDAWFRRGR
ncbi:MAG: DoxX family protein [Caulobacteraceae bacterium]